MTDCAVCKWIAKKEGVVYEDDKIVAVTAPTPAIAGHLWVMPKKHTPILEQVADEVASELFIKGNKLSMALFEALGAHGTNMLIQNGVSAGQTYPHAILHIIPRMENDNLNLQWKPKQLDEEVMSTVELKIKEEAKTIGLPEEPPKPIEKPKEVARKEDDYLIKQLRRIP